MSTALFCLLLILAFASEAKSRLRRRTDFHRIVGGSASKIEKFPHLVSIRLVNAHACGGSIISEKFVLTASHCRVAESEKLYTVVAGATYSNHDGEIFNIKNFVRHEEFNETTLDNDIALIEVDGTFNFSKKVQPVRLPPPNLTLEDGKMLKIAGWGDTKLQMVKFLLKTFGRERRRDYNFIQKAVTLQEAAVPVVSFKRCRKAFRRTEHSITHNMICAGNRGVDACQGDSGGGVLCDDELVGIVSWGLGCADPKYFGVYTNVPKYIDWIEKHTN